MQCPSKLVKNGNSPHGNFLIAHFDQNSFPASVRVLLSGKPTNDVQSINGNSGVWTSGDKYTSTDVALQLLDQQGTVLNTCKFDISGQPAPNKDAQIINAIALYTGGNVGVSWKSTVEVELRTYIVERQNSGIIDKTLLVTNVLGANMDYAVVDDEIYEDISVYKYQISALFNDNSKLLLVDLSVSTGA
jgi:hypothetical protein